MLRWVLLIVGGLAAGVGSYLGTAYYLTRGAATTAADPWRDYQGGRSANWTLKAEAGRFVAASSIKLKPAGDGIEIASLIERGKPKDGTDGAAYHFTPGSAPVLTGKSITAAFDITAAVYESGTHEIELMVGQNGLKVSGWQKLAVKPGRHIYSIKYEPASETRASGQQVDSFWVKSDASGGGRAVVVHQIRVFRD